MQTEVLTIDKAKRNQSRMVLVGLFALFFVPVFGAVVVAVFAPHWVPFGSINNGELIQPPVADALRDLKVLDGGDAPAPSDDELWIIAHVSDGSCPPRCEYALRQMRQARLALGKDAHRVERWWLVTARPDVPMLERMLRDWPGMRIGQIPAQSALAARALPLSAVQMIDPAGFLLLWYPDDAVEGEPANSKRTLASALLKDFKRLLKISKRS